MLTGALHLALLLLGCVPVVGCWLGLPQNEPVAAGSWSTASWPRAAGLAPLKFHAEAAQQLVVAVKVDAGQGQSAQRPGQWLLWRAVAGCGGQGESAAWPRA